MRMCRRESLKSGVGEVKLSDATTTTLMACSSSPMVAEAHQHPGWIGNGSAGIYFRPRALWYYTRVNTD